MEHVYNTQGTCSKQIIVTTDSSGKTIDSVVFVGGCPGNTAGISSLVRGMSVSDVISRFEGIRCGLKPTSCPDQLARALGEMELQILQKQ